jgi:hypothetical protein
MESPMKSAKDAANISMFNRRKDSKGSLFSKVQTEMVSRDSATCFSVPFPTFIASVKVDFACIQAHVPLRLKHFNGFRVTVSGIAKGFFNSLIPNSHTARLCWCV